MKTESLSEIKIDIAWKNVSPELAKEIVQYWEDAKLGPVPESRAQQVIAVARNPEGNIAGISTAELQMIQALKNKMYVFRASLHPDYRLPGLLEYIIVSSIEHLEATYKTNDPESIGVFAKVENPQLKKHRTVKARTGLNFIGFAPNGDPVRAHFFRGVKY